MDRFRKRRVRSLVSSSRKRAAVKKDVSPGALVFQRAAVVPGCLFLKTCPGANYGACIIGLNIQTEAAPRSIVPYQLQSAGK
mgnify:FL=1